MVKKEFKGVRVYVAKLRTMVEANDQNEQLLRNLGHENLFENDDKDKEEPSEQPSVDTQRVKKSKRTK